MNTFSKVSTALVFGLGFAGAAMAQDSTEELAPGQLVNVTCDDFLMADAAAQLDYVSALGVMPMEGTELNAETQADVDTIDYGAEEVAAACEGHEAMDLLEIPAMMMGMMDEMGTEETVESTN